MRYRALSIDGDYQFGMAGTFLVDSPEAVAQAILTRLRLWTGEWFLDAKEGTDYLGKVLGHGTQGTRDIEVKARILGTAGVVELLSYSSSVVGRDMRVTATVRTAYGVVTVNAGA